jgi:DNA (cytosine-5)-methyltransferase 1
VTIASIGDIPRVRQPWLDGLDEGLIVDLFAGGGGASIGIEQALAAAGIHRHVDLAVNHDADAIACHGRNHPLTEHRQEDVFDIPPVAATGGRPVALLWASPDCTDFSKAKGGKPNRSIKRRSLAWVVVRWAFAVRPAVIMLENVEEFRDWGLLDGDGMPVRDGRCFEAWRDSLRHLGYRVESNILRACDYGAPTTRKRLFVVARCDGRPIIWPEVTHGAVAGGHYLGEEENNKQPQDGAVYASRASRLRQKLDTGNSTGGRLPDAKRVDHSLGRLKPYRTAASCIDWSEPMLSIFATADQAKAWARAHGRPCPRRPLAENTMRRIASGVVRYVLQAKRPFIVRMGHQSNITGESRRFRWQSVDKPLSTVTAGYHDKALMCPVMVQHNHGQKPHYRADEPVRTICAGGTHHALVAAFLAKYYGEGGQWQSPADPLHTIPTVERFGLVTVELDGQTWAVVDIAMRMLKPRELARAQGFQDDYVIDEGKGGRKLSNRVQVRLIGNSVSPYMSRALTAANVVPHWGDLCAAVAREEVAA